jgi:CheY-like chemotaxis protein
VPTSVGRGRRILVVEGDVDREAALRPVLEAIGYAVTFAATIDAAIEAARVTPPHLVLGSPLLGPDERQELRRRIRLDPLLRDIPVGFLSS